MGCWFEPLELQCDAEEAHISVLFPHAFFQPWFERQGKIRFECSAQESTLTHWGQRASITYCPPPALAPEPLSHLGSVVGRPTPLKAAPKLSPDASKLPLDEDFDSFIANAKNAFPLTAARQVAEALTPPQYNPFLICGKSGTGKTHLLRALTRAMTRVHGQHTVFSAGADLFGESILAQGARDFTSRHKAIVVDDIQRVAHNRALQEKMVRMLDCAQDSHIQVILASTHAPATLEGLVDGLRSRLEVGLVVELKEADIEVRMRFAQTRARLHGLKLEREHILLLAQRCTHLRHLSGVILKITAFHSMVQRPITNADLENILRSSGEEKQVESADIIQAVGEHLEVSPEDILGSKRQPHCVRARQWAMFLCRELLGLSYPALGRFFGGKDHSTVMHSIKKITDMMNSDKDAQTLATELKRRCLSRG